MTSAEDDALDSRHRDRMPDLFPSDGRSGLNRFDEILGYRVLSADDCLCEILRYDPGHGPDWDDGPLLKRFMRKCG